MSRNLTPISRSYCWLDASRCCAEAARQTEAIVLAVPFDAAEAALRACGDLVGRIVIAATCLARGESG